MNGHECSRGGLKLQAHKPFPRTKDFYLAVLLQTAKFLFFCQKKKKYVLRIKKDGYIPKSGIFLCNELTKHFNLAGKNILDIGTGESGIIAIHASFFGAQTITAVDVDPVAVQWAKKNGGLNGIRNIRWQESDIFGSVSGSFDIIVSNPPQLPMKIGLLHDAGGVDGRKHLEKIIKHASQYLNHDGRLILLIFDFLGVDKSYGKKASLFDYYRKNNLNPVILGETTRVIRKGGQTEEALNHIRSIYPRFKFLRDNKDNIAHKIFIVSATIKK